MDPGINPPPRERRSRLERPIRFVRQRLSPNEYLGLHLTIGLLVVLLGGWSFSEIAEEIRPDAPNAALDRQVSDSFRAQASPGLTTAAQIVTELGSVRFLAAVSVVFAAIFVARRAWDRLLVLALTMLGGSLLNIALKHFFQRQRPQFENPLVTLSTFGFPSGHTMGATLLYLLLALLLAQTTARWSGRVAAFTCALLVIIAVGLTRIYLGAHYLTDVLAAFAAGAAWLMFCWTTVETFRRRRAHRAARVSRSARAD